MPKSAGTAREIDANGFLTIKGCPLSSFGIFDYGAGQIGMPGDPNRVVKVYRPESAVQDAVNSATFQNVPFIDDHEMLSGFEGDETAAAPEDKGVDGILTANVYYDAPWMRGDLKAFSRRLQKALDEGKHDLSLGYSCDFEFKSGMFNGQAYEAVQTNMRGNHIALVGEGRVPGARVLDGLCFDHLRFDVGPSDEENMANASGKGKVSKKTVDNAVEQLKALLPALQQFLTEEGKEPEHQGGGAAEGGAAEGAGAAQAGAAGGAAAGTEADAGAAEGGEEAAAGASGGDDLQGLIAQVKQCLAKLEGMVSAGAGAGGAAEGGEGGAADNLEGTQGAEATAKPGAKDGEGAGAVEGAGKASSGPAAGIHAGAEDKALARFYADSALKGRLYERLSKVVGTFDCAVMGASEISTYGVKKLGITCAKGTESIALDAYLSGVEKAAATAKPATQVKQGTQDAAFGSSAELDAYLKGE